MEEKRKITSGDKIPGCERLTRPEEIQGLSKYLGAIRDTQEQWISENMPDEPLEIEVKDETKLPDKKEMLEKHNLQLKTSRIDLTGIKEINLREELIKLGKVKEPELPRDVDKLHTGKEPDLPTEIDRIHPSDPELPKEIDIIHPEDPQLRPGLEQLKNVLDPSLPDSNVKLRVEDDLKLSKDRATLNVQYPKVSLPKSKSELKNIQDPSLPESMIGLSVDDNINLPNTKERLGNIEDPDLPKDSLGLHVTEPDKLSDFIDNLFVDDPYLKQGKIKINITEPDKLPWEVIGIDPTIPDELPSDRLYIHPEDPELPNKRLDIEPVDPELPDTLVELETKEVEELPKAALGINPDEIKELPGSSIKLDVPEDPKRIEEVLDSMESNELYEELMRLLISGQSGKEIGQFSGHGNLELAGIISAYLGSSQISGNRAREAAGKIAEILEKQKKLLQDAQYVGPKSVDRESTIENKREGSKIQIPDGTRKKPIELYTEEDKVLRGRYQTPDSENVLKDPSNFLNPAVYDQDRYIRRLAELAVNGSDNTILGGTYNGVGLSSSLRQYLLKTTLMALYIARNKLEKISGLDRNRLPGGSTLRQGIQKLVQGGATGLIGNNSGGILRGAINLGINLLDNDNYLPKNRPGKDGSMADSEKVFKSTFGLPDKTKILSDLENELTGKRAELSSMESFRMIYSQAPEEFYEQLEDNISYLKDNIDFLGRRKNTIEGDNFSDSGIAITLHDLCPHADNVSTIEDLHKALIESPYVTTPYKLSGMGTYGGNLTLDTNAYWEVVMEPYLSPSQNGGYSYLPDIGEINFENQRLHGINTAYGPWIPINNFELQKSKLVSKSLGLYDGEINYPTSIEYTNELRLTVVDDQYKSWRRYFQRCSDVSVFSSDAHKSNHYGNILSIPTAIDRTSICVAFYKNITFRIRIYCMTPQYSTIKKFDLLCVLKDFMEEYTGDIDGGASDLNISFSIVGENPPTDSEIEKYEKEDEETGDAITILDKLAKEKLEKEAAAKAAEESKEAEKVEPTPGTDPEKISDGETKPIKPPPPPKPDPTPVRGESLLSRKEKGTLGRTWYRDPTESSDVWDI